MRFLGVHHMTALEVDPVEFVSVASEAGCQTISVFTHQFDPQGGFPLVTAGNRKAVKDRLQDTGIGIANIDAFLILPDTDISVFQPALELGAELGARCATVQILDTENDRVVDILGRLCESASELRLSVGIEFMPLMPTWGTIQQAACLVAQVGKPNLGIGVDALHLVRSGGTPDDVAALTPERIFYAQLCDSKNLAVTPDYLDEAMGNRLAPGDGKFPLRALVDALPADTPLELEVPQPPGNPALERIRYAVAATRRLLQ